MPMKTRLIAALLILCLTAPAAAQDIAAPATLPPPSQTQAEATPAPLAARALRVGDSGDDVYLFKRRIQYLGYFNQDASLSDKVSDVTLERVNLLLEDNGMEPVTVITEEIQNMIFTRDDFAAVPTPTPSPTPRPLLMPEGTPALPELDAQGFLLDTDGEYIYEDAQDGLWYYISHDLYINIRRYNDLDKENIWAEAEIKTRGGEGLLSLLTKTRKTYRRPVDIARDNRAVLAFTDDYFTQRSYGVAVRDGVVYRDKIRTSSTSYPIGDTLAVFDNGLMLAYDYTAFTADEYLAMGAVHVLTFGPWLISGGALNQRVMTDTYMHYREPRCAIGMIEPGHYVVITVDGRYDGAQGVYFSWLASRMLETGAVEAVNLDGGGTTAMVFMGLQISRVAAAKSDGRYTRQVTSMLAFGTSDAVREPE